MKHSRRTVSGLPVWLDRVLAHRPSGTSLIVIALSLAVLIPALSMAYLSTAPTTDRNWYWQSPVPQGNDLRSMSWVGTTTAWAVGVQGTALKTTDGGRTWGVLDLGTTRDFTGTSFVSASTGWVVGLSGTIRKTTDGGSTWTTQTAPTSGNLRSVSFFNTSVGVAVGDTAATSTICYTSDGGTTWRQSATTSTVSLADVQMVSATTGWAVGGSGMVLKTVNGGANWTVVPQATTAGLSSISFNPSGTVGIFVGNSVASLPTMYRTVNSGATWTAISTVGTGASNLFGVSVLNTNTAAVVGATGIIRRTTDAGVTWVNQTQSNVGLALRETKLLDASNAYAIGDAGSMFYTKDGGGSWFSLGQGTLATWYATTFANANTAWIVGSGGGISKTSDAGLSWQNMSADTTVTWRAVASAAPTLAIVVGDAGRMRETTNGVDWVQRTTGTTVQLNGVSFMTSQTVWAIGNGDVLLRSQDGGVTWTTRNTNISGTPNLYSIRFADASNGWIVGAGGVMAHTTNGGNNWNQQAGSGTTQDLLDISAVSSSILWITGANGTVRKSTDSGASFVSQNTQVQAGANAVRTADFVDANTGWVTADYGIVRKTTDGGATYTTQTAGVPTSTADPLTHIWGGHFVNATTGYFVGDGGLVHRTVDGGSTWSSVQYGTLANLSRISFPTAFDGWMTGTGGALMHTSDAGQVWTQLESGSTANLNGIAMTDSLTGWIVGENGTIRRTTNGGLNWTAQVSNTTTSFAAVAAGDASHAIAAGAGTVKYTSNFGSTWVTASVIPTQPVTGLYMSGQTNAWAVSTRPSGTNVIWFTTDGGATWGSRPTTVTGNLWDIYFVDASTGFAVGDGGAILRTTNSGTSWIRLASPVASSLYAVRFTDAANGYIVGASGVLLRSSDGGATWTQRQTGTNQRLSAIGTAGTAHAFLVGDNAAILRNDSIAPPVTSLALAPSSPSGQNGWYAVTAPQITLTSSALTGVTYYGWSSSAGPYSTYSGSFPALEGAQTLYFYSVDTSGNAEVPKTQAISSDLTSPTVPTALGVSLLSTSSVTVTWTPGADAGSGVAYYNVYANNSFATSTTALTAQITGLTPNTEVTITVQAVDVAGLLSTPYSPALDFFTRSAATAPYVTVLTSTIPTPDGASGWYVTTPTVTLVSIPVDAQSRTTYYAWNSAGPSWSIYSVALTPPAGVSSLYFYTHDNVGSRVDEIPQVQPFLLDTERPATPTVLAAATSYSSINASWPAVPATPSGIDHYDIYVNGVLDRSGTATYVNLLGLTQSTTYTVNVRAVNSAGTTSGLSVTQTVTTPAAPLPSPPAVVCAKAINGSTIYLDWTLSNNVVGTPQYHIFRSTDGATYVPYATVSGGLRANSWIDAGPLLSSTRYWYAVSVIDSRGESSLSDTSTTLWPYTSATTLRPARPLGLTAAGVTPSSIFLTWSASSNPNVTGYYVYRAQSSLASTATTITPLGAAQAATALLDDHLNEGEPYYYFVRSVDASGAISFSSIEIEGHTTLSIPNGNVSPHESTPGNGCLCHASHTGSGEDKLTRFTGSSSVTLCARTCHAPGFSASQFTDPLAKSKHSMGATPTAQEPYTCLTCHVPLFQGGTPVANLMRVNGSSACVVVTNTPAGTGFCYQCHGTGSTLSQGDLTGFEGSVHALVAPPATGANITCDTCHESHSSRNEKLLKYSGVMICLQCHTASPSNPAVVDIYDKLTLNDAANSAHPLLPEDQVTGARMECQNCHNTHATTLTFPLVDPHNPSPTGVWANPLSDEIGFCERCHNGAALPTSVETTPWANPVLARNSVTTAYDMKTYYAANVHGFSQQSDGTTTSAYLRPDMGYKYGDVLQCRVCHEPHGAANSNGIRSDINSESGDKTISGVVTVRINGGGKDFRFFCNTCHVWDSATHDAMAGTSTVGFPMNCAACHTHALGAATPGTF